MLAERQEVARALDEELILWLTTVSPDAQPQSSAVWFLREGDDLLVYSREDATRLVNLAANDRVAMNLRGDLRADTVVTMEGTAVIVLGAPQAHRVDAYLKKYESEIDRLGWTPEEFGGLYPTLIRIRIGRIRAWG
jgi:PPOX class probable F420-dependent enzyme